METIATPPIPGSGAPPVLPSPQSSEAALHPAPLWNRLAASGTGIAIAVGADSLDILVVRVRPSRVSVVAYQRFTGIKERPAAELGAEYAQFLRRNGVPHLAATVLLPREELIVRTLALPGVAAKDLESAIELQMESLHPYLDQDVRFGFVRVGKSPQVLVGIAREELVDRWIAFCEEAGIKLAGFTFAADVLYRAIRSLRMPPAGFATVIECGEAVEIYGESAARPIYDTLLYAEAGPALNHAASELRLSSESDLRELAELLPAPDTVEQAEFAHQHPLLYATALTAAAALPLPSANLLPAELRKGSNWNVLLPTLILAGVLALLVAGMYAQRAWLDREYTERLAKEVQLLERQVAAGQRMDEEGDRALTRLDLIKDYRERTNADLEALMALTRILPDDAWVTQMDLSRTEITIAGEATRAGDLIQLIDASPLFEKSEFAMPLQRVQDRELFRLRIQREVAK